MCYDHYPDIAVSQLLLRPSKTRKGIHFYIHRIIAGQWTNNKEEIYQRAKNSINLIIYRLFKMLMQLDFVTESNIMTFLYLICHKGSIGSVMWYGIPLLVTLRLSNVFEMQLYFMKNIAFLSCAKLGVSDGSEIK